MLRLNTAFFILGFGLFSLILPINNGKAQQQVDAPQQAQLITQTLPERMHVGDTHPLTIKLQNKSTTPWHHTNLALIFSDTSLWGTARAVLNKGEVIKPGETKTFKLTIHAPQKTGHLPFSWQLTLKNSPIYEHQGSILVETTAHSARFVSQLFPSQVNPGESFKVLIQYQNIGKNTWNGSSGHYLLRSTLKNKHPLWGVREVQLAHHENIQTSATATFSFTATAPLTPGVYPFQWALMHAQKGIFGELTPDSFIKVGQDLHGARTTATEAEFIALHAPDTMVAGQEYETTVIFKNTGGTSWWSGNVYLVSANPRDNLTWFINQVDYAGAGITPPGDIHAFRFFVRAPEDAGSYPFQWQLFDSINQKAFGEQSENKTITIIPR